MKDFNKRGKSKSAKTSKKIRADKLEQQLRKHRYFENIEEDWKHRLENKDNTEADTEADDDDEEE